MTIRYCMEITDEDYDTYEDAYAACLEHIQPWEYWEHVHDIEPRRIFEALTDPKKAEEIFEEIIRITEQQYAEWYIHEYEEEDEEDEEDA